MTRVGRGKGEGERAWRSAARADDEGLHKTLVVLGERVVALRKAATLTQEALAAKANLDVRHLQDLEYGRSNATIATLRTLAKALGVSLSELLRDVE